MHYCYLSLNDFINMICASQLPLMPAGLPYVPIPAKLATIGISTDNDAVLPIRLGPTLTVPAIKLAVSKSAPPTFSLFCK